MNKIGKRADKNKELSNVEEPLVLNIDDWNKKQKALYNREKNPYLENSETNSGMTQPSGSGSGSGITSETYYTFENVEGDDESRDASDEGEISEEMPDDFYYFDEDENDDESEDRKRRNILLGMGIIVGFTLLSGLGFIGYRILDRSKPEEPTATQTTSLPFKGENVFEYGEPVILDMDDFIYKQSLTYDMSKTLKMESELMTNKNKYEYDKSTKQVISRGKKYLDIGKYKVDFKYKEHRKSHIESMNIIVEDTTSPEFMHAPSTLYIAKGAKVSLKDYFKATDLDKVTLKTQGAKFRTDMPGKYNMTVAAQDRSGNKETNYTKVVILDAKDLVSGKRKLSKTLKGDIPMPSTLRDEVEKLKLDKAKEEADKKLEEEKKKQEEEKKRQEEEKKKQEEEEAKRQEELMKRTGWEGLCYYDKGTMLKGYKQVEGNWYYFDLVTGQRVSGWAHINGNKYYFGQDGKQVFNTFIKDVYGDSYFISANGTHVTGWQIINNKTYYFYNDGKQAFGEVEIEGSTHTFDPVTGEWKA